MSAAAKIPDVLVDKITLLAYQLCPHPCATIIKDCVDEANDENILDFDDYLKNYYEPCDEDGNDLETEYDDSNYYVDAEREDGIIYDQDYIHENLYEDYKDAILDMMLYEKLHLRSLPRGRRMKPHIC